MHASYSNMRIGYIGPINTAVEISLPMMSVARTASMSLHFVAIKSEMTLIFRDPTTLHQPQGYPIAMTHDSMGIVAS